MTEPQQELTPLKGVVSEHVHIWGILDVWQQPERQYHPQIRPRDITVVLIRCKDCNFPQTIELQGTWTLEQLLRNDARIYRKEER
jgi:hypothetical protein